MYRCVGSTGAVSYQTGSCTHGMRVDKTIDYVAETPRGTASLPMRSHTPRVGGRLNRQAHEFPGTKGASRRGPDSCATETAKRARALVRLGMKRTYDQLARLDEPVRAACNGF